MGFFGWPGRAVRGDKLFRAPLPPGAVPECNIGAQGKYRYLSDLLALKSADSDRPRPFPSLPEVCDAGFALHPRWLVWASFLRRHPDPEFAAFILRGVLGFRIGCAASDQPVLSCRNMRSAGENPHVVANYLEAELLAGRLVRVDPSADLRVHLSPFGVIPKRGQPDKWRLINDLCPGWPQRQRRDQPGPVLHSLCFPRCRGVDGQGGRRRHSLSEAGPPTRLPHGPGAS